MKIGMTKSQKNEVEKRAAQLRRVRAQGIFDQAMQGETFGDHPGYVDLRIRFSVYNAVTKREEKLPGKSIELLVSNINEVEAAMEVMNRALANWIAGI